jgi:predicted DNA-binding transcriptional regulator YafY
LVSLVLTLQARGRVTARDLASELEVSVRTVYRDLEALSAAGVPVVAESGPGGGCQLLEDYRFPLRGLRPDEAEALLILGVPDALRDLGLDGAIAAAHRQVRVTSGLGGSSGRPEPTASLVHLDMPRWFRSHERVPHLRDLATALRRNRQVRLRYERPGGDPAPRVLAPLGLVNKAGVWYLVAVSRSDRITAFRAERITSVQVLDEAASRPPDFDLPAFWERWSREFQASRPRLPVKIRASAQALAVFPEIFGDAVREAVDAALPPDEHGWRELALSFEHEKAAAHRLAGFGGQVEVLSPAAVREDLLATAREILSRYGASTAADIYLISELG